MADDIETKISALIDIFTLFDRDTVGQVLKDNNNNFENAAAALSEMEAPKPQPTSLPPKQPAPAPLSQRPVYPQQQQQQRPTAPSAQPKPSQQQVVKQVTDMMGGAKFDVNQSTIFDVYQATGGNVDQTVQALKNLNAPDPALEEQKRALERMERERMEREKMRQRLDLLKEKQAREQENLEQVIRSAELEQIKKAELEQAKRIEMEQAKRAAELEQAKRVEMENQEKEFLRYEIMRQEKLAQERRAAEELDAALEKQAREQAAIEKMHQARAEKQRIEKEAVARYEQERAAKEREEADKQTKLMIERERKALEQERFEREREVAKQQMAAQELKKQLELEREKLGQELAAQERKIKLEQERASKEQEEKLLRSHMERMQIQAEKMAAQEARLKALEEEQACKELAYQQKLEQIERLKNEEADRTRALEEELKIREQRETELSNLVSNQTISVTLRVEQLNEIIVSYDLAGQVHASCWVGIFPTHQPKHDRYLTYNTIIGNTGSVNFPGIIPGHYEARLFTNRYDMLVTSSSVKIGPSVSLTAHVLGDEIHVTYKVDPASTHSASDWIGLYTKSARNKKYVAMVYASASGTAVFKSPRTPGQYQVRYFVSPTKYNEQAIATFEIVDMDKIEVLTPIVCKGDEIKIEYSVNTVVPSTSDWIGLFALADENNKNYLYSTYTNSTTGNGIITFTAPDKPGNYEVRFFSASVGRYTTFKTSNKFVITP